MFYKQWTGCCCEDRACAWPCSMLLFDGHTEHGSTLPTHGLILAFAFAGSRYGTVVDKRPVDKVVSVSPGYINQTGGSLSPMSDPGSQPRITWIWSNSLTLALVIRKK